MNLTMPDLWVQLVPWPLNRYRQRLNRYHPVRIIQRTRPIAPDTDHFKELEQTESRHRFHEHQQYKSRVTLASQPSSNRYPLLLRSTRALGQTGKLPPFQTGTAPPRSAMILHQFGSSQSIASAPNMGMRLLKISRFRRRSRCAWSMLAHVPLFISLCALLSFHLHFHHLCPHITKAHFHRQDKEKAQE